MNQGRRKFLQQMGAVCAGGVARTLGVGCTAAVTTNVVASVPGAIAVGFAAAPLAGAYGSGVRAQVLEVVVRQALAGAPWKEICKGPLAVNNITEAEVEAEVERRSSISHSDGGFCQCTKCMKAKWAKTKEEMKAQDTIPHSEKSPCACRDCRKAVNAMLADQLKKVREQLGQG
jgi:hypothetical protein